MRVKTIMVANGDTREIEPGWGVWEVLPYQSGGVTSHVIVVLIQDDDMPSEDAHAPDV